MNKLNIETGILQSLVAKAIKNAPNDKMLPITNMMLIEAVDGVVYLRTTDGANHLCVYKEVANVKDFYVVVLADVFAKLVAKTTVKEVELSVSNNTLEFVGNGKYTIELPLDEEGELVTYPKPELENEGETFKVESSKLSNIAKNHSLSILDDKSIPFMSGYFFSDVGIITTDASNLSHSKTVIFEKPTLLSKSLIDLFELLEASVTITEYADRQRFKFEGPNVEIIGWALDGVEKYPIEQIKPQLEANYVGGMVLDRDVFMAAIDRMNLFASAYETGVLILGFTNNELQIGNQNQSGAEVITVNKVVRESEDYGCLVGTETLLDYVRIMGLGEIEIDYNNPVSIRLQGKDVQHVISLQVM